MRQLLLGGAMSRFRSTDNTYPTSISHVVYTAVPNDNRGAPYNTPKVDYFGVKYGTSRNMTDEVNPGFTNRKKRGEVILSNVSISNWTRDFSPGSQAGYLPTWKENWERYGDLIGECELVTSAFTTNYSGTFAAGMRNEALVKVLAKVNSSSLLSGEILSDMGRTIEMLQHPFKSSRDLLTKVFKAKRRYLKKSGSNLAQACSNAWLESRFGWGPIFIDMETIIDEVHKSRWNLSTTGRQVARASVSESWSSDRPFVNAMADAGFYFPRYYTGAVQTEESLTASAGIIFQSLDESTITRMNKILGTRANDLLPTVYEKIPYSFVVDRFVNLGDWCQAIQPNPYIKILGSWVSTKQDRRISTSASVWSGTSGGGSLTGSAGSSTVSTNAFTRLVNPSLGSITPVVSRELLNLRNSADAMSLATRPILAMLAGFKKP